MFLPWDMPGLVAVVLSDLILRFGAEPGLTFRGGTVSGQPGHLVIFPHNPW